MPKLADYPITIQPYINHGLDVDIRGDEAIGDCVFCGKENKFSIDVERGVWKCWVCTEGSDNGGGNIYTFLSLIYEMGKSKTSDLIPQLAKEKGIINLSTLEDWGVFIHPLTDEISLAGFNKEGSLNNIYFYREDYETEKMRWMPTKGLSHSLLGIHLYDSKKENILLCEGLFDAMTLYETLGFTKQEIDPQDENSFELSFTGSVDESMLGTHNILAIPSANVFHDKWVEVFSKKKVYLLPHNDYPRRNNETGKVYEPVGFAGMRKIAGEICSQDSPSKSVEYLSWHPAGDSFDPARPSGYDVRDLLNESNSESVTYEERLDNLVSLISLCREIPASWTKSEKKSSALEGMEPLECKDWKTLENAWRKALKWTDGHRGGLACMLACIASTNSKGDQLWMRILGPAGSAKTALCRGLGVSKKYVLEGSIITGLHSGWRAKNENGEAQDFSLINKMRNKTFVMKDGDTLLQTPNVAQIMSQLRDLFDGETSSHYRSQDTKDEKGHRTTIIICGTSSLKQMDSSEYGERFIDYVIMKEIDIVLEKDIVKRAIYAADRNTRQQVNGRLDGHFSLEMGNALKLTGGYVGYLRRNVEELLKNIETKESDIDLCSDLAVFTAFMRARQSKKQDEEKERELATRLGSQLWRLALCLAVVLNKTEIDDEVMGIVKKVALDTSSGKTLEIVEVLYKMGHKGETTESISHKATHDSKKILGYLAFLRGIKVVEPFNPIYHGVRGEMRWRLTQYVSNLYQKIMGLTR